MKNKLSFSDCYKILHAQPGLSIKELRRTYKSQIQKWHPDKFSIKDPKKEVAENKIQNTTSAYKILVDYHREHGELPPISRDDHKAEARTAGKRRKVAEPVERQEVVGSSSTTRFNANLRHKISIITLIIVFTILMSMNLSDIEPQKSANNKFNQATDDKQSQLDYSLQKKSKSDNPLNYFKEHSITASEADENTISLTALSAAYYFTEGSSIADVLTAQGTPDKIEKGIWYYGQSEIHFEKEKVSSWKRSIEHPLNARIEISQFNLKNKPDTDTE